MNPILELQREAPVKLALLIAGKSEAALRHAPAPGKWSVVEVVAHLAEDELSSSWRYRQMLENPGSALAGFDQDEWARRGQYAQWDLRDALEMFRLLRAANVRLLAGLKEDEWSLWGTHSERGRMTVAELAAHMNKHDARHMAQIERILAGRHSH
ncbi:MAG: DinB family protein [Candidatus Solibacter sp.]